MTSTEIKKQLHCYIEMIEDETKLEILNEAAEAYAVRQPDILDLLTLGQLEKLKESQKQIEEGKGIPHEEVMKTARQWVKEHTK